MDKSNRGTHRDGCWESQMGDTLADGALCIENLEEVRSEKAGWELSPQSDNLPFEDIDKILGEDGE